MDYFVRDADGRVYKRCVNTMTENTAPSEDYIHVPLTLPVLRIRTYPGTTMFITRAGIMYSVKETGITKVLCWDEEENFVHVVDVTIFRCHSKRRIILLSRKGELYVRKEKDAIRDEEGVVLEWTVDKFLHVPPISKIQNAIDPEWNPTPFFLTVDRDNNLLGIVITPYTRTSETYTVENLKGIPIKGVYVCGTKNLVLDYDGNLYDIIEWYGYIACVKIETLGPVQKLVYSSRQIAILTKSGRIACKGLNQFAFRYSEFHSAVADIGEYPGGIVICSDKGEITAWRCDPEFLINGQDGQDGHFLLDEVHSFNKPGVRIVIGDEIENEIPRSRRVKSARS